MSQAGANAALAGDKMTMTDDGDQTVYSFDDKGTGRVCGSCTLCCKLVPVPTLRKPAGTRCRHARALKGCAIHAKRPEACRLWSCRWLADPRTAGLPRPDRCHYVIDPSYDYVTLVDKATGEQRHVEVVQVWVDPAFPQAHHAPELRAHMERMAVEQGVATIVRFNSRRAITIFPPPLTGGRRWHLVDDGVVEARTPGEQAILDGWDQSRRMPAEGVRPEGVRPEGVRPEGVRP